MRKIKFRAWDGDRIWPCIDLIFIDGELTAFGAYTCQSSDSYARQEIDPNVHIVMQFTGLLDKNGVEIYEGDIVEQYGYGEDTDWLEKTPQSRHEVTLENFRLWVKDESLGVELEDLVEPETCVVIGNVFEHPELLLGLQPERIVHSVEP